MAPFICPNFFDILSRSLIPLSSDLASRLHIWEYFVIFVVSVSIKCFDVSKKHPEPSELAGAER